MQWLFIQFKAFLGFTSKQIHVTIIYTRTQRVVFKYSWATPNNFRFPKLMSAGCKSLQIGYKSCLATDFNSHTQTKSHQVLLEAQRLISALILPVVGFLQVIIRGDVLCCHMHPLRSLHHIHSNHLHVTQCCTKTIIPITGIQFMWN